MKTLMYGNDKMKYVPFFTLQMKNLCNIKLATCLYTTRVHTEEERSDGADKEDEIKKDWMLAAAVLDRICAITFTVIFAGGTFTFLVVFVARS